jgi:2Fe-2S ferredoxin
MVEISFVKSKRVIMVLPGSNLMAVLLANGIPVASSCRGDGVCAKCRIEVVSGIEHLSPANGLEQFLHERYCLADCVRISCQTTVHGPVTIDTTYW